MYYLLRDKRIMTKLRDEIDANFKSYDEIKAATASKLPYLSAVLNEAMRIYPAIAWQPCRVVPPGGDTVDGYFLPGGVRALVVIYPLQMC
jgi:cytochrome P450